MDVLCMYSFSTERSRSSRMDGHIVSPNGCENTQGIRCCLFKRRIAVNSADSKESQGRVVSGKEDRESILGAL